MDGVAVLSLLNEARKANFDVHVDDGVLMIEGPEDRADIAKALQLRKAEVIAALDPDGGECREDGIFGRFEVGTKVRAGDRGNIGTVLSDDGGEDVEIHFVSKDGKEATKPIPRGELSRLESDNPTATEGGVHPAEPEASRIVPINQLIQGYPKLRPAVIHGVAREGETINFIAAPKMGKSFCVGYLALAVALGMDWMGFPTRKGRVLIIDNELHCETIADRLRQIADALDIPLATIADMIDVFPARGLRMDLVRLGGIFQGFNAGDYALVIVDAWYRALPDGTDENDNGAITEAYNLLDSYANNLKCVFALIHHASKGNQSAKAITDVGSGAGSQSRAADAHLILRPHKEDGVAVLEAVVRSFPKVEPRCFRWTFPIWTLADGYDPADKKSDKPGRPTTGTREETAKRGAARIIEELEKSFVPITERQLRIASGINTDRWDEAFGLVRAELVATQIKSSNGRKYEAFSLPERAAEPAGPAEQKQLNLAGPLPRSSGTGTLPLGSPVPFRCSGDGFEDGENQTSNSVPLLNGQRRYAEFDQFNEAPPITKIVTSAGDTMGQETLVRCDG